ncbi:hypothetical protein GCM10009546_54180 [Actinomadura livida]|uniref:Uncharacterized protein n=1 Tax=Actinomadura livida TaxID=79909 RepID=A0ABP3QC14_9ACTN|nr:hypothetical protein GCM10010208_51590 [Actinomadura livida]
MLARVVAAVRLAVALVQFYSDMPGVRPRERDPPVDEIHDPILTDRGSGRDTHVIVLACGPAPPMMITPS